MVRKKPHFGLRSSIPETARFFWKRSFLAALLASQAVAIAAETNLEPDLRGEPHIVTVEGPVAVEDVGRALTHEHLFSTFRLSEQEAAEKFDADAIYEAVLPRLLDARKQGVDIIFDCTALNFGRNVRLLSRLSKSSGVSLVTNTGVYGAAKDFHISKAVAQMTANDLAAAWVAEFQEGIEGTDVRPGFIKIGVDPGPLSAIDEKLVRAAARTHLATGLTIASHTGGSVESAGAQLAILREEGVDLSAWIWTHAHQVKDAEPLIEAARSGAWISLDGLRANTQEQHLECLSWLRDAGLLGRVLLSHDGNAYPVSGSSPRGFDLLYGDFLQRLADAGFSEEEVRQLTVLNPREAFAVRVPQ